MWLLSRSPELTYVGAFFLLVILIYFCFFALLKGESIRRRAKFLSDILLVLPLAAGVIAATLEINDVLREREIERQTINTQINLIRQFEIERRVSTGMVAVADIAAQYRPYCDVQNPNPTSKFANILGQHFQRGMDNLKNHTCPSVSNEDQVCHSLDNLRRNSLVWAAAPSRAAENLGHSDVQCFLSGVKEAYHPIKTAMERSGLRVSKLVELFASDLSDLNVLVIDAKELKMPDELTEFERNYFWFWLLTFAAAIEISRKIIELYGPER